MKHPASDRLSLLLDGDLPAEEAREVEEHLASCEECAALFRDLDAIRVSARALEDLHPTQDLWPGIARALSRGEDAEATVIPLPIGPMDRSRRERRGFRLSYSQAAAAGIVLALVSGALGATLGAGASPSGPDSGAPPIAAEAPGSEGEAPPLVLMVRSAGPELEAPAREVARLEELLTRHRGELGPETVRILEKSLGVIDKAIRESLAALEQDPGNRFLKDHLHRALQAKAEYLKDATSLVAPES